MKKELWKWTAAELAPAIASGAVSSAEAANSTLARMTTVNPKVNAVVDGLSEDATRTAQTADAAVRADRPAGPATWCPDYHQDQRGLRKSGHK